MRTEEYINPLLLNISIVITRKEAPVGYGTTDAFIMLNKTAPKGRLPTDQDE